MLFYICNTALLLLFSENFANMPRR